MGKTVLITAVVLIVIIGGYFIFRGGYQAPTPTPTPFSVPQVQIKEGSLEEVKAKFTGTTLADWEGYQKEPFCIDGSVIGKPELGAMGFHAGNLGLLDFEISPLEPEVLLLDADENIVGVEYMVPSKERGRPEIFGQPFDVSEPHPPVVEQPHYDLHLWLIDNPAGLFAAFNPNITCPEGSLPPAPSPEAAPPAIKELTISGTEYSFSPASITVSAGDQVKVTFRNNGSIIHNFKISELGIGTKTIGPGEADVVEFTAPTSGTYDILCSIPGHRAAGMEGSLRVE